jgi:hypothetical protein
VASVEVDAPRSVVARRRTSTLLERDGLLVAIVVGFAACVTFRLPLRISQDTWLTLVGGRQLLHHGLPGPDTLTYWTTGKDWIDQQWLAQLATFGLFKVGGLKLLALVHVAFITAALGLSLLTGRLRGGSPRAVAWLSLGTVYLFALSAGHVRAQSFAFPLFAVVLLLLVTDKRGSTRVLLTLPLLVLWANVHGSVVVGAALVGLKGLTMLFESTRERDSGTSRTCGSLLVAGSVVACLITPNGLRIVPYYHEMLLNPSFRSLVAEWRPPTLTLWFVPLYAAAGLSFWLLGRRPTQFRRFDRLALILLVGLAFLAIRNIMWLALAITPLLAPALDAELPRTRPAPARANKAFALAAAAFAVISVLAAASRSPEAYAAPYPPAAASAVARAAAHDPSLRIYSDIHYADWLLFTQPELEGRIGWDARLELLSAEQLTQIARFRAGIDGWRAAAGGARLIVLDPRTEERAIETALLSEPGSRRLYRDDRISVLLRPRA